MTYAAAAKARPSVTRVFPATQPALHGVPSQPAQRPAIARTPPAQAATARPPPASVEFVYLEDTRTQMIRAPHLPCVLDVEPSDYASVALAQAQFSQSASELQALDRSGDLSKYAVHSADGSRVQYSRIGAITRHSDRKEERKTLMGDVETLKPTVRCLEGEVRELQGIMQGTKAELQESKAELQEIKAELQEIRAELRDMQTTMIDWQVATNLIDGYSEMLWNDLPEDQKDALGAHIRHDHPPFMLFRILEEVNKPQ